MGDGPYRKRTSGDSIAGLSADQFVTRDDSLAALLLNRGITVRDFILLSFLSDQGPLSIAQLSNVVGIEPNGIMQSLKRLSSVGLVLRAPKGPNEGNNMMVILTGRGQDIARRIADQLE